MADTMYNLKFTTIASVSGNDITVDDPSMLRDDSSSFIDADFLVWAAGETPVPSNSEYVRPTADDNGTFTLSRQQQSSSLRTIAVGDYIALSPSALVINSKVNNSGDETIAGVKTFSSSPVVPTPTTDMQAATKKYVDDNAGGGGASELDDLSDVDTSGVSDGDMLTYDSDTSTWKPAESSGGGGGGSHDPFAANLYTIYPHINDPYYTNNDSSNVTTTMQSGYININIDQSAINQSAGIVYTSPAKYDTSGIWDTKSVYLRAHVGWMPDHRADFYIHAAGSYVPSNTNVKHMAFATGASSEARATNASGSAQTYTDISASLTAGFGERKLEILSTPGTNIKYYINNTLVATHTTNLPTGNAVVTLGFVHRKGAYNIQSQSRVGMLRLDIF